MENKLLLNHEQTEALNKILNNLSLDTSKESDLTTYGHLTNAADSCEDIQSLLDSISNSISSAICDSGSSPCDTMTHLADMPMAFSKLKQLVKEAEDELARAAKAFDSAVEKTNLKYVFSDEEFVDLIEPYFDKAGTFELEKRDNDIFIIFTDYEKEDSEENTKEFCIATNARFPGELNIVEKYVNKLLGGM